MATAPKPLFDPQAEKLRQIQSIPALVKYLDEELGWPVGVDDWEDAVYDWQPQELNLKAEHQVAVKSIKQLRPLVTGQPWGIFFVEFHKGRLPITVLRRMLNGLIIKSRVQGSGHQTWMARDLLFVSSFGEGSSAHPREIALAHFTDESELGDIPVLRVLGWDEADTALELSYVAKTLKEKLCWPARTDSQAEQDAWRTQWASAFSLKYRQVINDAKSLALALAELAKRIRSRANAVLALESEKGHLRQLHQAFRDNLIADLSADGFADMFAQTITYGLFTAHASRESGALVADNLTDMVPSTNPFLKELLGDFLSAGGRHRHKAKRVDFDELGINEVVTTLRDVPMDAVLRSFNASKPGDDPVIHFYEDFLKAYDKAMRAKRGVFYTPSPVVQFIVRSVDEILRTEFGIEDGLASTITWGEMMVLKPELRLPRSCTAATPFVQVLDPATGTGTFIVEVITQIHAHMLAKWAKQGKVTKAQWQPLWVDYVKQHLLPRLYAFELMMAPYAIAHMKIGLKLAETGYTFPEDGPRVNVFLTNALEPAHAINPRLEFEAPMLAHEAAAANRVKEQLAATVVVGNPPYSLQSANMEPAHRALIDAYKYINGVKIVEKGALQFEKNLNDDYVKFIRFSELRLAAPGIGVLGVITNHTFLENGTLRGLRASLLDSFNTIWLCDLNGNANKQERLADGSTDENVFEIKQGVSITIAARGNLQERNGVYRTEMRGAQATKLEWLLTASISKIAWAAIRPIAPKFAFLPTNSQFDEYAAFHPIDSVLLVSGAGYITARDSLVIDLDRARLTSRIGEVQNFQGDDQSLLEKFKVSEKIGWDVSAARSALKGVNITRAVIPTVYRPFDERWTFYDGSLVWGRSWPTMRHVVGIERNLSLTTVKQVAESEGYSHAAVAIHPVDNRAMFSSRGVALIFPLWKIGNADTDGNQTSSKATNLSNSFVAAFCSALKLTVADYRPEDPTAPLHAEKIFHYLYAVLYSPAYRQRYAAFLRTDFPRIPIPGSRKVFDALAKLGAELVAWHLLEHQDAINIVASGARSTRATAWFGTDYSLAKVAEKSRELADVQGTDDKVGKVYINATSGFANVHQSIWQHTIGGYQVLHKWLDDRRKAGRSLSQDDITHWLRVYAALEATQKLMQQVDVAIEANGGWPSAFSQNHPPPDAATLAAEQMVQKEQLKAQKKATTATKKRAAYASPTGASSLFDDLEDMAGAAGGPDRPKSRATPAKAAGGKASGSAVQVNGSNEGQLMCTIRRTLASAGIGGLSRDDLIRSTARELGHARTSPALKAELDTAIRRAVRRGIAENSGGVLTVLVKDIDGYDRDHLKAQLLAAIRAVGGTCPKIDAPMLLARALGFARTGAGITVVVESVLRSLVRAKLVESKAGQVRVLRRSE